MDAEDELDEIRKKKMLQLQMQQQVAERSAMQQQQEAIDTQRQAILRKVMSPEARERLSTVRMAYPERARNVEDQLITLAQQGRLSKIVEDSDLKLILKRMQPKKKDISIKMR